MVDVGGGSSEIAVGTLEGGVEWWMSFRIGSGFLTDHYLHSDPPSAAELHAMREHAHGVMEGLEIPPLYTAHEREVFDRDGMLYAVSDHIERMDGEEPFTEWVRYRTVGDMSCTGAVRSTATTLEDVVAEIAATRVTERGETRADDRVSEAAMEDRKREGYF